MRAYPSLLLLVAAAATAGDGVFEINQLCVDAGCFAGDTEGFPVQITQSGSYRLTSNLTVENQNTDAIQLASPDVDLDLNGFSVLGVVNCSGDGPTCAPASGSGGISGFNLSNVRIRDGTVRGFTVGIGSGSARSIVIENVRVISNGGDGIQLSGSGIIRNVLVKDNGGNGIQIFPDVTANYALTVMDSVIVNNAASGVIGGLCSRNTFFSNTPTPNASQTVCDGYFDFNLCEGVPCL